jgi:hypothetical protein
MPDDESKDKSLVVEFELADIPWPLADDDLLAEDPDWWFVACLNFQKGDWYGYTEGFKEATNVMFQHIAHTHTHQDLLVFPFALCWRHHIELVLKKLIIDLKIWLGETGDFRPTHSIDGLWKEARLLLERWGHASDDDLHNVEKVLAQLHQLDPTAEHFRYPLLRSGSPTLPSLGRLHIRRFHEAMSRVASYLGAADNYLTVLRDERAEYESEMAREADWQ